MLSAQETEFLNKEVQHMLLMKAIRETTDPRVVTSSEVLDEATWTGLAEELSTPEHAFPAGGLHG